MKKSIGIVMVFLFVLINASKSYAVQIDSLRLTVRNMPNDTLKVIELIDLSNKFIKIKIDTSDKLVRDAINLSKELNYYYGYAYALKQMGLVYKYKSQYDSSLICYEKSFLCFDSLKIEFEKARLINRTANVHKRIGKFERSLDEFLYALDIALAIRDSVLISAIYNNLGILYSDIKEYDKALEYHLLNISFIRSGNIKDEISSKLINIGNIYKSKKEYKAALNYYKEALDVIPIDVINYDKLLILHNIGAVYQKKGRLDEAYNYYQKALLLEHELGNKSLKIYTLQGIGLILIKIGKFSEGEEYLKESFQLAEKTGDLPKQSKIASSLRWFYENQKQYKKSLKYSKLYTELEDSIFSIEKIKQIIFIEQKYEAEKREHKIITLEKEQALLQIELANKELENRKKSLQQNGLIVTIILVLLFALYYGIENKKRRKINNLLKVQNKKILHQRTEIVKYNNDLTESNKTKDKLFQVIAHDLRNPLTTVDGIAHLIPYWLDNQDFDSLHKLSETLGQSVKNVLLLVDDLLNWALEQQNNFPIRSQSFYLKEVIFMSTEIYSPIAEIKNISLKFDCAEDIRVFADKNIFTAVIRNLLDNALNYSPEKGEIIIGVEKDNTFAKIGVKVSGIGVAKEKREAIFELTEGKRKGIKGEERKNLGLFFCKEFVEMNKGDIFIDNVIGKGSSIAFTIPLFSLGDN